MRRNSGTHAIGIDLGTTYSCLSYLTPAGQPQTLPNLEGELSTPSVVFFDGDDAIVGTEALRNSVTCPERVVQHAKRHMGDPRKQWVIGGKVYTPKEISALIVRKLLDGAEQQLGIKISRAVITVPAQFSEIQRQWTVEAGRMAGLEHVDIINEPVAAALCHVLSEGMWFSAIANDQNVMVFDLGGGTFDLSLVRYNQNEVRVKASGGDLHLGGLDWNTALEQFACNQFAKETGNDPRLDLESMQALNIEVEQVKRALSVRPKATLMLQHSGRRKTYAVDRAQFEELTRDLVKRTENITLGMLKANRLGWQNVDAVLVTGGSSRMPMIRDMLQRISGTTLNTTLSPDQSISHGAAYYAGMILSGQPLESSSLDKEAKAKLSRVKQQSVNARALGILVRNMESGQRVPHYLIPANTPLPVAFRQKFGTVVANQRRVHLFIVESGTSDADAPVELGQVVVDQLPEKLPIGSPIEVTIRYDEQARVHVEAKETVSGKSARTTIVRESSAAATATSSADDWSSPDIETQAQADVKPTEPPRKKPTAAAAAPPSVALGKAVFVPASKSDKAAVARTGQKPQQRKPVSPPKARLSIPLEEAERPVPLCNHCGEPLDPRGHCTACRAGQKPAAAAAQPRRKTAPVKAPRKGDSAK